MLKRIEREQRKDNETDVKPKAPWSRCLILASRGVSAKQRYLMQDLISMIPHNKKEPKFDDKRHFHEIAEICDLRNCDTCIFFENRKHTDLYLWFCCAPHGPSIKFFVENITTMSNLKLTGNALKGSRPIISFGAEFDSSNENKIIKEILSKIFHVEQNYPKSKPFIDHILQFSTVDDRIWMRNYQIVDGSGNEKLSLVEIGPRYCMRCIKILSGCFSGSVVYLNEKYVSPNVIRSMERREAQLSAARSKQITKEKSEEQKNIVEKKSFLDEVFDNEVKIEEDEKENKESSN
uniref:Ribosome biogenesis protein, putative n=1 Tax=Entamoeba histolytica TaxID=5759 RepID=S0AWR7_ENTHI|nr:ribosome biogenesis protein, putative [Entamoeba histolytica]